MPQDFGRGGLSQHNELLIGITRVHYLIDVIHWHTIYRTQCSQALCF